MDMTPQTAWLLAISAVVIVGVIAFFIGRSSAGTKGRIDELEAELARKGEEAERYRKEVDAHFDKTATLFVSMAGSYKDLFEHLSSGYEKLSAGSARDLFKERFASVLLDGSAASRMIAGEEATAAADEAATVDEPAEVAPPKPVENEDAGREAPAADEAAPSGEESAPDSREARKAAAEESADDAAKPPAGEPAMAPEDDTRKRAEAPETAEGAEEAAAGAEAAADKSK